VSKEVLFSIMISLGRWVDSFGRSNNAEEIFSFCKQHYPGCIAKWHVYRSLQLDGYEFVKLGIVKSLEELKSIDINHLRKFLTKYRDNNNPSRLRSWTTSIFSARDFKRYFNYKSTVYVIIEDDVVGVDLQMLRSWIQYQRESKLLKNDPEVKQKYKEFRWQIQAYVKNESEVLAPMNINTIKIKEMSIDKRL
jgi:hypothetical protein